MARDPKEIGTLWLNEWQGRTFYKGAAFEVPSSGITVELIPFSYQRKDGSGETRGLRVIRVETTPQQQPGMSLDEARRAIDEGLL